MMYRITCNFIIKWNHADATGQKDEIQLIGKNGIVLISRIDVRFY